jgi:hypothetical protein
LNFGACPFAFLPATGYRAANFTPAFPNPCDPETVMKIFLGVLAVLVVAASVFADYKWRQWMAARRRNRQ